MNEQHMSSNTTKPINNRCFCGQKQKKSEETVKRLLLEAAARKRAEKELKFLLEQFHGRKKLVELLPAIQRRCSEAALNLAIERVERRKDELSTEDFVFFEQFKVSLQAK